MKRLLLATLLLCSYAIGMKADGGKALFLELEAGTKMAFVLSEQPEMSFSDGKLLMKVKNSTTQFQVAAVRQFYFADAATGIAALKDNDLKIVRNAAGKVVVEGIGENDKIRVYTVGGTLCNGCTSTAGNRAEISLASLPKGTYIISISNKQTFKINKQ